MRSPGLKPCAGVVQPNAAPELQAAGISLQRRPGLRLVARTEQDHMPPAQPVAPIQLRIPGRRAVGDKIRPQPLRFGTQGAADELLNLAFVQIDARTKHIGRLTQSSPDARRQKLSAAFHAPPA